MQATTSERSALRKLLPSGNSFLPHYKWGSSNSIEGRIMLLRHEFATMASIKRPGKIVCIGRNFAFVDSIILKLSITSLGVQS